MIMATQMTRDAWCALLRSRVQLALQLSYRHYYMWEHRGFYEPKNALSAKTKSVVKFDRIITDDPRSHDEHCL